MFIKNAGIEAHHKRYKVNQSMRTHVAKEHNNQDNTTNINKIEDHKLKKCHLPQIG
jgi:hypothetical protein